LYVVKEKRKEVGWIGSGMILRRFELELVPPRPVPSGAFPSCGRAVVPSFLLSSFGHAIWRCKDTGSIIDGSFVHSQSGLFPAPSSDPFDLTGSPYHSGRCHTWNPATPHTAYLDVKLQTRYITVCRSAASLRPRTWQTHKSRMVSGLELSTKP
jgi:hypothetical protein